MYSKSNHASYSDLARSEGAIELADRHQASATRLCSSPSPRLTRQRLERREVRAPIQVRQQPPHRGVDGVVDGLCLLRLAHARQRAPLPALLLEVARGESNDGVPAAR